jgi:hypothetical protein
MAGPPSKAERPILKSIFSSFGRRRTAAVAAAVLVIANVIGFGAYFSRHPAERPHAVPTTEATPSWRLEASSDTPDPTRRPNGRTQVEGATATAPVDPAEIVTPELLRAANRSPCAPDPSSKADVRQFGAKGNGRTDDTEAIQKANDAVAKRGGGRVVFPPGVYRAMGVQQDSCVEFTGSKYATLLHPDGTSPAAIIEGRLRSTDGSIARNSRVLTVESTRGIRPGVLVAIQAADGRSRLQRTKLSSSLTPYVKTITVQNTKGLQRGWRNYLYVENEVISYDGISGNNLLNVQRGLFGTPQTHHGAGRVVAQAQRMYAVVVRVTGKRITLDRPSSMRVQNADVKIGALGMSVVGLTLDGRRRPPGVADANPLPLSYQLSRWVTLRDSTIKNGDHGGVRFDMGTRDSVIEDNAFIDHGDAGDEMGSAIWLFRGATDNVVRGNAISGHTFTGVTVDDRTIHSTEFDAESNGNTIEDNTIDMPSFAPTKSAAIFIAGSSGCRVINNTTSNARTGVMVARSAQAPISSVAHQNSVRDNIFAGHNVAIYVSGSDNDFVRNEIRETQNAWKNSGQRNRFIDNTIIS